ncbi:MAG: NADP-specific glutamate dehydrogenase [Rhodobacteraceae bacterium]|nr:MAG: NADP-specific glutamate dehydrogenase [Paracoccaceae bacterium]
MTDRATALTRTLIDDLRARSADDAPWLDAVESLAHDVLTVEKADADFAAARVLERLAEPDRVIAFRVTWRDDVGAVQINRGWRVQQSNLLGPYKGGLRWHPDTTLPVLKSLAFEQVFKNALTGLPLGGAKGGADFDPRGRSAGEIERFARAFMAELAHHIGPDRDVPAGDMGVGGRELGLMSRAWMIHARAWGGALTGKPLCIGGSLLRAEATGYGLVFFLCAMLAAVGEEIEGKRIALSGRGNVALHAARKARALGGRVIALSARAGVWHAPDGFSHEALDWLAEATDDTAANPPARLGLTFHAGRKPWDLEPEIALPCATQNEIDAGDARALIDGGCCYLAEGANMPLTAEAEAVLKRAGIVLAPGKAANAGGVAVSGLEMRQNAGFAQWSAARVEQELREIICAIHDRVAEEGRSAGNGAPDYRKGANRAAYRCLAQAVIEGGAL